VHLVGTSVLEDYLRPTCRETELSAGISPHISALRFILVEYLSEQTKMPRMLFHFYADFYIKNTSKRKYQKTVILIYRQVQDITHIYLENFGQKLQIVT
jgi:hypothetical protein